jgi:hypothetical protein
LLAGSAFSQGVHPFRKKTVRGFSRNIYDRFDKKYDYKHSIASVKSKIAVKVVKAGYFNVFLAKDCGIENDSDSLHIKRRKVLLGVLSDFSAMIKVPGTGNFTRVNLLLDPLSSHLSRYNANIPGMGSSFYTFPHSPSNPYPGIVDAQVYKEFFRGSDSTDDEKGRVLHGFIALNFDSGIKWNLDTKRDCAGDEYDLYTVCFRELMHCLGLASLIGPDGYSVFGKENNYYSRYDMFLRTVDMVPMLSYSATLFPLYDLRFNAAKSKLNSNDNFSLTKNEIYYDSIYKIPVCLSCPDEAPGMFNYFEKGTERCVMSCVDLHGYTARTLSEQEKQVLIDLKYPLTDAVSHKYYSAPVWGDNDGVGLEDYIYKSDGEQISIPKWGANGILSNDSRLVIDASFVRNVYAESGYVANNPREIIFTPAQVFSGVTILEYIPVDGKGNYGNITYIYVSVSKNRQKRNSAEKK